MRWFVVFYFIILCGQIAQSQFTTQSAEGKSSMPLPLKGAGVSVDIGKAEVVLGLNNYGVVFDSIRNISFWGISLSGKNSDGLADLFDAGDIVGEGNLLAIGGYSISNNKKILKEYVDSKLYDTIKLAIDSADKLFRVIYPDSLLHMIRATKKLIKDKEQQAIVLAELTEKISSTRPDLIADLLNRSDLITGILNKYGAGDEDLKNFMDSIRSQQIHILKDIALRYENIQDRNKVRTASANKIFSKTVTPWRLSFFMQGGISARAFKRYLGTSTPNFNKSFQDTLFRGGQFGLGANFQIGDFTFGILYNYLKSDNFATLTNKNYTIITTDTSMNQTFVEEKKVSAYAGKYSFVEVNEFNADILYSIKLNKSDSSRLLINPYIRGSWHSRDTAFLANYTNIGLGAYFLGKARKFMGGLYVELPDINNNIEKAKPEAERNLQSPFKRLSFGVVTKINLNSVFAFTDRPRRPD